MFFNDAKRLVLKTSHNTKGGTVPTSDVQNDSMYLCPVTIGEGANAVTVNLDFDTGSADLWGNLTS